MKERIKTFFRRNYFLYIAACSFRKLFCNLRAGIEIQNYGCARIKKDAVGDNNVLNIGKNSIIHKLNLYIRGNRVNIEIGKDVIIGKRRSIRCEGDNIRIVIGDNTTMTRDVHICAQENGTSIELGKNCMLSNNIIIRTSDSHPIYDDKGERLNPPQNVRIGNHVWIAPESTILKGVTVEDNAIIGSKSLVTKDVLESTLVAGIPAKVVREKIQWSRENLF